MLEIWREKIWPVSALDVGGGPALPWIPEFRTIGKRKEGEGVHGSHGPAPHQALGWWSEPGSGPWLMVSAWMGPELVVGAQPGQAPAEVMQVVDLAVQHLQEALQLHLQVALPVLALLHICLQGPHLVFQVLIVPLSRL